MAQLEARLSEPKPRPEVKRNLKAEGRIIDAVAEWFTEQELIDLAYDVALDFEKILGAGIRGKAAGMVRHFANRGNLGLLVTQLEAERPHVDWHHMLLDTNELK